MPASAERVSRHHWSDWVGLIVFTGLALALWRRSVEFGLALLPVFCYELLAAISFILRRPLQRGASGLTPRFVAYAHAFVPMIFLEAASRWRPDWLRATDDPRLNLLGIALWLAGGLMAFWPMWYLRRRLQHRAPGTGPRHHGAVPLRPAPDLHDVLPGQRRALAPPPDPAVRHRPCDLGAPAPAPDSLRGAGARCRVPGVRRLPPTGGRLRAPTRDGGAGPGSLSDGVRPSAAVALRHHLRHLGARGADRLRQPPPQQRRRPGPPPSAGRDDAGAGRAAPHRRLLAHRRRQAVPRLRMAKRDHCTRSPRAPAVSPG